LKIKKLISIIIISLFIFLLIIGCTEKSENIKIRLPWLHQAQYAGIYVAMSKGFFEKRGLKNIEILQGGPNVRPIDLVSSGSEQFSITGSTPFLNSYKEGRPIKIVATLDQKHAFCYFARKDQNINSPVDFKGKRVGYKVMHEHNLDALLKSANLTKDDINVVPVPPSMNLFFVSSINELIPIWPGHAADEPLLAEERGIEVNYFFPEDYDGIPRIGNLIFTSSEYERKHQDIVKEVVFAIIEGWEYAFDNIDYAVEETIKYMNGTEQDKIHQKNMLIRMKDFMLINKIGWCDKERWQQVLSYFIKNNADANFTLDEMLTNKYVEEYYNTKTSN